jgi:hypothetical protein
VQKAIVWPTSSLTRPVRVFLVRTTDDRNGSTESQFNGAAREAAIQFWFVISPQRSVRIFDSAEIDLIVQETGGGGGRGEVGYVTFS